MSASSPTWDGRWVLPLSSLEPARPHLVRVRVWLELRAMPSASEVEGMGLRLIGEATLPRGLLVN